MRAKLTPLRTLDLLCEVELERGRFEGSDPHRHDSQRAHGTRTHWVLERTARELRAHLEAMIVKAPRRRRAKR